MCSLEVLPFKKDERSNAYHGQVYVSWVIIVSKIPVLMELLF